MVDFDTLYMACIYVRACVCEGRQMESRRMVLVSPEEPKGIQHNGQATRAGRHMGTKGAGVLTTSTRYSNIAHTHSG